MSLSGDVPFPVTPTATQPGPPPRQRKDLATYLPTSLPSFLRHDQALNHDVGKTNYN